MISKKASLDEELWEDFFKGSRLACARIITAVENAPEVIPDVMDVLAPHQKGAIRIGVTGPPGVGKSTVTAALAREAVEAKHTVSVIAVDPTSPYTGGAFLGDRVRMQELGASRNVFIRSLASREGHGGLSPSTPYAADIFDAFGMSRIFIETVGVGQAELDVLTCADIVILVLQPGTGDIIQALKAGILEIADIFLVNKADLPGTEILLDSLKFLLEISARQNIKSVPPVLEASALRNSGLQEAYSEVERLIKGLVESGGHFEKRRGRLEREIRSAIERDLWNKFEVQTDAAAEIRNVAGELVKERRSPYPYVREMSSRISINVSHERAHREEGE